MSEITWLLESLDQRLEGYLTLSGGVVSTRPPEIDHDEWRLVQAAGEKRQREFASGRRFAHKALKQLGITAGPIGRDDRGCPQWPETIVGSISHTDIYCVAAVASQNDYRSVGVDLEEIERMKSSLWPRLFTPVEIANLKEHMDEFRQLTHAAIIFSAKEALYKCDYPLNRRWLDFMDVQVTICDKSGHLSLTSTKDNKPMGYQGCYVAGDTHVLTAVYTSLN